MRKVMNFIKGALPTVAVAAVVYLALRKLENSNEKVRAALS